jgi:hypothetical protein
MLAGPVLFRAVPDPFRQHVKAEIGRGAYGELTDGPPGLDARIWSRAQRFDADIGLAVD